MRLVSALSLALFVCTVAACSSASPPSTGATPAAPSAFLLQYVGEYDGADSAGFGRLVLHADGSLDATVDGQATRGSFAGPSAPGNSHGNVSIALTTIDGQTFTASFRTVLSTWPVPAQSVIDIARSGAPTQTLVAPWGAGSEDMCAATDGAWHDDDADARSGLYCTCQDGKLFMPSRGGCVAAAKDGSDPVRVGMSDGVRQRVGEYDGSSRVASLVLATDGTFRASIDGNAEQGSFWDEGLHGSRADDLVVGCTGTVHAFAATIHGDGSMTVQFGDGAGETLRAAGSR